MLTLICRLVLELPVFFRMSLRVIIYARKRYVMFFPPPKDVFLTLRKISFLHMNKKIKGIFILERMDQYLDIFGSFLLGGKCSMTLEMLYLVQYHLGLCFMELE